MKAVLEQVADLVVDAETMRGYELGATIMLIWMRRRCLALNEGRRSCSFGCGDAALLWMSSDHHVHVEAETMLDFEGRSKVMLLWMRRRCLTLK